jgi:hypothetical protein
MRTSKVLSLLSLAFGVLFFAQGTAGFLWPASPAMDVGLFSTSAVFVLFGVFGLLLHKKAVDAPKA